MAQVQEGKTALDLEQRVNILGRRLSDRISRVVDSVEGRPQGPIKLAKEMGVDKMLASRLLRAAAHRDPVAVLQLMPGPDPLRAFAAAASRKGAPQTIVAEFMASVDEFEQMIRAEAGDRGGFDAILTCWLPNARRGFETRRKQSIFKAMSQLKGVVADTYVASALIAPSAGGEFLDVVWTFAYHGLQRLRPNATFKVATRRVSTPHGGSARPRPRHPRSLEGAEVHGMEDLIIRDYSTDPLPPFNVHAAGDVMHYTLGDKRFGPRATLDLVLTENNPQELPRAIPAAPRRKRFVYIDISTPTKLFVFDLLLHRDIQGPSDVGLLLYDTGAQGIADVNDRSRDIDRMEMAETVQSLGRGVDGCRISEAPWYVEHLGNICRRLGLNPDEFRPYRARIDYPLYSSQIALTYDGLTTPEPDAAAD